LRSGDAGPGATRETDSPGAGRRASKHGALPADVAKVWCNDPSFPCPAQPTAAHHQRRTVTQVRHAIKELHYFLVAEHDGQTMGTHDARKVLIAPGHLERGQAEKFQRRNLLIDAFRLQTTLVELKQQVLADGFLIEQVRAPVEKTSHTRPRGRHSFVVWQARDCAAACLRSCVDVRASCDAPELDLSVGADSSSVSQGQPWRQQQNSQRHLIPRSGLVHREAAPVAAPVTTSGNRPCLEKTRTDSKVPTPRCWRPLTIAFQCVRKFAGVHFTREKGSLGRPRFPWHRARRSFRSQREYFSLRLLSRHAAKTAEVRKS
jgi:hypothetical protein